MLKDTLTIIRRAIFEPRKLFTDLEPNTRDALTYFIILDLIQSALFSLSFYISLKFLAYLLPFVSLLSYIVSFSFFILFPILIALSLVGFVIGNGILHLWLKIFGTKGNFQSTLTAAAIAQTPIALLNWIPIINFIAALYGFYIFLVGMSTYHKISMLRVFAGIVILYVVLIGITVVLAGIAFVYISTIIPLSLPGHALTPSSGSTLQTTSQFPNYSNYGGTYNGVGTSFSNQNLWQDWKAISFGTSSTYIPVCTENTDWTVGTNSVDNSVALNEIDTFVCSYGVYKCFSTTPGNSYTLSFSYKAASSTSTSTVTNAKYDLYSGCVNPSTSSTPFQSNSVVNGGTTDSGWQNYNTQFTAPSNMVTLFLYTHDGWVANWNKVNWFRGVSVS